jgi:hypothetical protein
MCSLSLLKPASGPSPVWFSIFLTNYNKSNRIISVFFIAPPLSLLYCLSVGISRTDKIIGHVFFLNTPSINAHTMKHTTPAKIALFDDIKPNPAANINMLPSNSRIIGITLIICSRISAISIQKNQVASTLDHAPSHR